jgi:hypothetical protein
MAIEWPWELEHGSVDFRRPFHQWTVPQLDRSSSWPLKRADRGRCLGASAGVYDISECMTDYSRTDFDYLT